MCPTPGLSGPDRLPGPAQLGIDIERDEIVFFPLLYWPVKPDATVPSDAALASIDAFMKTGGTIFFDPARMVTCPTH
jgi:hypothetical protein